MSKHRETTPCRDLKVRVSRSNQKRSETFVTTSATPSSLFPLLGQHLPLVTDGHGSSDTAKLILHSNSTSLPKLKAPKRSDNPSTTYQVASRFEPRTPFPPDPTLPTSDVPSPLPPPPMFMPPTYVSPNLIVMAGRTERRSTGDRPTAPDENSLH
ncbi:hypothetical protein CDEST_12243 [Colletotrichum destructivum]|uniref:Uncharacterized protein n=1 Tax=Colletotrichum destructivum TaxID=34406 RepID=A0AAX4IVI3_9PEZI|nr:hypothetical protein CDEST_12243 [Colletotrichum destructivum]